MEAGIEFLAKFKLHHKPTTGQLFKVNVYNDANKLLAHTSLSLDHLVGTPSQTVEYGLSMDVPHEALLGGDPTLVIRKDRVVMAAALVMATKSNRPLPVPAPAL